MKRDKSCFIVQTCMVSRVMEKCVKLWTSSICEPGSLGLRLNKVNEEKKKKERVLCGCEHTWRLNEMERERDSCADERWRIRMNWSLKMPKTKEFKFQTLWESTDTYMCTANEADYFFFKPWYGYGFKLWLQVKLRVLRPKIIICLY